MDEAVSGSPYELAARLLGVAWESLNEEQYRMVLKTVRGLVRQSPKLPGPELSPYFELDSTDE